MTITDMVIRPTMIVLDYKFSCDAIALFVKTGTMGLRWIFWEENPLLKQKLMISIHEKIVN